MSTYWDSRKEYAYYKKVLKLISVHKHNSRSIIDVGACDTEILMDIDFEDKVSLDIDKLPTNPNIRGIKAQFLYMGTRQKI